MSRELDLGNDANSTTHFSINKNYAEKYTATKRRQELTGREAQNLLRRGDDDDYSSSETSESEDSDADELTPEIEVNIFKTIQMIRNKDPQIYDQDKKWFDRSETGGAAAAAAARSKKNGSGKGEDDQPVTFYKDYMRQRLQKAVDRGYASEEGSDVEDDQDSATSSSSSSSSTITTTAGGLSYHEEQAEMKRAFLQSNQEAGGNDGDDDDDDFLKVRPKTQEELTQEEADAATLRDRLASKMPRNEQEAVQHYFSAKPADASEQFLRDYVMNREWQDHNEGDALPSVRRGADETTNSRRGGGLLDDDDDDNEQADEQADRFERAYNFRFEEPTQLDGGSRSRLGGGGGSGGGANAHITTYSRTVEGSMRRKGDKRKEQRELRKKRKEEEKRAKREELKRLKNLKRQEMQERLRKIEEETGMTGLLERSGLTADDMDGDFDPDTFDQKMQAMFNDGYYEEGDEVEGGGEAEGGQEEEQGEQEEEQEEELNEVAQNGLKVARETRALGLKELDELEYEDIVGGQKTRFKYRSVEATSFGLSTDEILNARDSLLGQFVPVKKLAPYREEEWVVSARQRRQFRQNSARQEEEARTKRKGKEGDGEDGDDGEENEEDKRKRELEEMLSSSSSSSLSSSSAEVAPPPKQKKKRVRKKQAARAANQGKDLDELRAELARAEEAKDLAAKEAAKETAGDASAESAAAAATKKEKKKGKKRKRDKVDRRNEEERAKDEKKDKEAKRLASYGDDVVLASKKKKKKRKKSKE